MKILLPLDGDRVSEQVIPLILQEATAVAEFTLLRVVRPAHSHVIADTMVLGVGMIALNSEIEDAELSEAQAYLEGVVSAYEGLKGRSHCEARLGPASSVGIIQFAETEGMDLIAMSVRERTGLARLIKGATSRNVIRSSNAKVRIFGAAGAHSAHAAADDQMEGGAALAECELFRDLTSPQRDSIWALGTIENVDPGQVLVRGGDIASTLYVVLWGEAQMTVPSATGQQIPVRVDAIGDTFPVASLLGAVPLITSGTAITAMKVLAIPSENLIKLCANEPTIGHVLYRAAALGFARRYSETVRQLSRAVE